MAENSDSEKIVERDADELGRVGEGAGVTTGRRNEQRDLDIVKSVRTRYAKNITS